MVETKRQANQRENEMEFNIIAILFLSIIAMIAFFLV